MKFSLCSQKKQKKNAMLQLVCSMNQQPNLPHVQYKPVVHEAHPEINVQRNFANGVNTEWPTFYGSFLSRKLFCGSVSNSELLFFFRDSSMGVGETATFYLQTNRVLHIISWRVVSRPSFWPLPLLGWRPKHMM